MGAINPDLNTLDHTGRHGIHVRVETGHPAEEGKLAPNGKRLHGLLPLTVLLAVGVEVGFRPETGFQGLLHLL